MFGKIRCFSPCANSFCCFCRSREKLSKCLCMDSITNHEPTLQPLRDLIRKTLYPLSETLRKVQRQIQKLIQISINILHIKRLYKKFSHTTVMPFTFLDEHIYLICCHLLYLRVAFVQVSCCTKRSKVCFYENTSNRIKGERERAMRVRAMRPIGLLAQRSHFEI